MWWGRILTAIIALASITSCVRGVSVTPVPAGGCRSDLRLVLGACVAPAIAAQACGATAIATLDGCTARPPCEAGRARDLTTGACLPLRDVRALASSVGILVDDDQVLECPDGGELATASVDGAPRLGCLPPPAGKPMICAAHALPDVKGACVRVLDGGRVDVTGWLQSAIGPDGGEGAPPLCKALQRSPGALAVSGTVDVHVELRLDFPDNDISQVTARVKGSGAAPNELEQALVPFVEALRTLGGTANQASIATAVRCVRRSERPAPRALTEIR